MLRSVWWLIERKAEKCMNGSGSGSGSGGNTYNCITHDAWWYAYLRVPACNLHQSYAPHQWPIPFLLGISINIDAVLLSVAPLRKCIFDVRLWTFSRAIISLWNALFIFYRHFGCSCMRNDGCLVYVFDNARWQYITQSIDQMIAHGSWIKIIRKQRQ